MKRGYLTVTYEDGNTESIPLKPAGIVAAERKYGGDFPAIEGTIYAAWFVKGMPGEFNDWLNSLAHASDHEGDNVTPLDPGPPPEA